MIVDRRELRDRIADLLAMLLRQVPPARHAVATTERPKPACTSPTAPAAPA